MTRRSLFECITRQEPGNEVIWVDWIKTAGWLISLCALLLFLQPSPAWGTPARIERTPLTPELLQERLHTPILREGSVVVDLREMVIDLGPENASFRDNFYQILRKELQKAGSKPLGLDLSRSLIQGDFIGSNLSLRTPLYTQAVAPILISTEQEQLERLREICLQSLALAFPSSKDCKSLLATQLPLSSEISVFRGSLTLLETRFDGIVQFANTFFLQPVDAQGAIFNQQVNWTETRFSRPASFGSAIFKKESQFQNSIFFEKANFKQAQFQQSTNFQDSTFEDIANFTQAYFKQLAKFSRVQWQGNADFSNAHFAIKHSLQKLCSDSFSFL